MTLTSEDLNNIKELRKATGNKLMTCKKAYLEAEKDVSKSVELLRYDDRFSDCLPHVLIYHKPINESEENKMSNEEIKKQCCCETMVGKCDCCGKENVPLQRMTFKYTGMPCECHSPYHFIIRNHCKDCTPKEPAYDNVNFKIEDLKNPIPIAMKILQTALSEDKSHGSYYDSWQANIACAIMDNCKNVSHEDANKAATSFLTNLMS